MEYEIFGFLLYCCVFSGNSRKKTRSCVVANSICSQKASISFPFNILTPLRLSQSKITGLQSQEVKMKMSS